MSGCRECQSLVPLSEDSRDNSCGRCAQVHGLPSLVEELRDEVERLKRIRDFEEETDWWSHTLPCLRETHFPSASQEAMDPLPFHHQAERGDLERWRGMKPGVCSGYQVHPFPTHLTFTSEFAQ